MKQLFSGQEFFKMLKIGSIAALIVMTSLFFLPDRPDTYQIIMTKIIIIFFINIVPYFIAGVYCGKHLLGNSLSKSFWLVVPMPFVFMLVIIIKNPSWLNISGIENLLMIAGGFGAFFYLIAFFVSFAGVSYGNHLSINRNKYYITPPFFKIAIIVMIVILLVVALKMFFG